MKVKKAIIPLGGMSTRFLPASKSIPKEMFPVVDKPIIQYLIEELSASGITDILLIIGRNRECLMKHFDEAPELFKMLEKENKVELLKKAKHPCNLANLSYLKILEPNGVADALMNAKEFICDEPFIVAFGDEMFYNPSFSATKQLLKEFEKVNKSVIGCYEIPKEDVYKYGIMKVKNVNDALQVESIIEKPKIDESPSTLCAVGKYLLTSDIFNKIEEVSVNFDKEKNFTQALNLLALDNNLVACNLKGERYDTGTKFGYLLANVCYALHDDEISKQFMDELKKIIK